MKHLSSTFILIVAMLILHHSCEKPDPTDLLPKITTTEVSLVTEASALSGGYIDSDAGYEISACGVCWSTSPNPTITDNITQDSIISGSFISKIVGLNPNTTYYLRAYATNKNGIAYGLEETFTTKSIGITTMEVSEITVNSAQSGGVIVIDGDSSDIIARGVCWNTAPNPTIEHFKTNDGKGIGEFNSALTELAVNTVYYVRSYATNSGGTYYGNEDSFITRNGVINLSTNPVTSIKDNAAVSGGNITDDGGATITDRGVCWSTTTNPTTSDFKTSDGNDSGVFISSITGLTPVTTYYVRAYATNSVGTAYGNEESFITNYTYGEVTNPTTGRIWIDRNVGALQVATSSTDALSYGDLYQWGRAADGHEKRISTTTNVLSSNDNPGHGNFILTNNTPKDWRSPQNDYLWQGVNGINNPCPAGYRVPTSAEWTTEVASWSSKNSIGAFASPLKLPMAGYRDGSSGSVGGVGTYGSYWSSSIGSTASHSLNVNNNSASLYSYIRSLGYSVRCIKD